MKLPVVLSYVSDDDPVGAVETVKSVRLIPDTEGVASTHCDVSTS